jgi:hypothetical protein
MSFIGTSETLVVTNAAMDGHDALIFNIPVLQ